MSVAVKVELLGAAELARTLDQVGVLGRGRVAAAIEATAQAIRQGARARVRVKSGRTRRSIRIVFDRDRLGAEVGTTFFIARFLEFGTVKQPARPFFGPAVEAEREPHLRRLEAALEGAVTEAAR